MALKTKGKTPEEPDAKSAQLEKQRLYGLREPEPPSVFDLFVQRLEPSAKPFAELYWHMQCEHEDEEQVVALTSYTEGWQVTHVRCRNCGAFRTWQGTRSETKRREWDSYCPDGYDAFDWQSLYVKDREMWQFIHDEVLADMVIETMKED